MGEAGATATRKEPSALTGLDQLRPDVIGRHDSNDGFVGGKLLLESFGGSQHDDAELAGVGRANWTGAGDAEQVFLFKGLREHF